MGHLNYEYVTSHVIWWFCVIGGCSPHLPSVSVILRHTASKPTQYDALFEPDSISAFCTRVDARRRTSTRVYVSALIDYAEFEYCVNARRRASTRVVR